MPTPNSHSSFLKAPCLYTLLDLPTTATKAQIKSSYYQLCKTVHPDYNTTDPQTAHHRFIALNDAYEVLSDDLKRANYDHRMGYSNAINTAEPNRQTSFHHRTDNSSSYSSHPNSNPSNPHANPNYPNPGYYRHTSFSHSNNRSSNSNRNSNPFFDATGKGHFHRYATGNTNSTYHGVFNEPFYEQCANSTMSSYYQQLYQRNYDAYMMEKKRTVRMNRYSHASILAISLIVIMMVNHSIG